MTRLVLLAIAVGIVTPIVAATIAAVIMIAGASVAGAPDDWRFLGLAIGSAVALTLLNWILNR